MDKVDKKDPRTVFVRGISYDIGDPELTEAFSGVGPVRHAFLVKGGARNKSHKGFGFVQFALEEDATRAVEHFNGKDLHGRKLSVESALKRAPLEERKSKRKLVKDDDNEKNDEVAKKVKGVKEKDKTVKTPVAKKLRPTEPLKAKKERSDGKHALVRTVALGGLTPTTVDAAIALGKEKGTVEAVLNPAPAEVVGKYKFEQDGCFGEVVLLQYSNTKEAMAAIASLHGHKLIGTTLSRKKQAASLLLWARQVSGEGLHLKRWRVVVRNLPFKATEDSIRAAFAPAGFIWEVTIPRNAEGESRGFAFVGFICRAHAERAIQLVNGTSVDGRPVAVDWAISKREFEAGIQDQTRPEEEGVVGASENISSSDEDRLPSELDDDEDGPEVELAGGKTKKRPGFVSRM